MALIVGGGIDDDEQVVAQCVSRSRPPKMKRVKGCNASLDHLRLKLLHFVDFKHFQLNVWVEDLMN